ncbi:hypothetical protein QU24_09405 [Pantoea rodasii]|uniref:Uncharacterized protein n=2 Tax=Pantoea TaxID=53335 RepID=A0A0U3UCJ1_9GAMM|nr:hypothetical protein LK04_13055 [Pantoea vagans]KHJ68226.1 hypothetical protein QU24_09405 [Pantoea rodasii]
MLIQINKTRDITNFTAGFTHGKRYKLRCINSVIIVIFQEFVSGVASAILSPPLITLLLDKD